MMLNKHMSDKVSTKAAQLSSFLILGGLGRKMGVSLSFIVKSEFSRGKFERKG